MQMVYVFSGLGADKRIFQHIDFSGCEVTHIEWIPTQEGESIAQYAQRLLPQIKTELPVLIGVSFGGMLASEVAKLIDVKKIILISSAQTRQDIPFYCRLLGYLKFHHLLPVSLFLNMPPFILAWLFGVYRVEDRQLLNRILRETDPVFLKWALGAILRWDNMQRHPYAVHLHGTHDKVLPARYCKPHITVAQGGHLMVLAQADKVSQIIRSELVRDDSLA